MLLTLLFVNQPVDGDPCSFSELPRNELCIAQIDCYNYYDFDMTTWNCIKHEQNNYNYRRYPVQYYYDNIYNLIINVKEAREMNLFLQKVDNFIKLTVEDGDLIAIPDEVYSMKRLQEVHISGNKISTINFNRFIPMSVLREINLRNNLIKFIELDNANNPTVILDVSSVEIIDISNNCIEMIPERFVSRFNGLKHLNLSHNIIRSIDIHTFEGLAELQILDMSYNKLLNVGNAFARFANLRELSISNNNIKQLFDINFVTLTNLAKLNVSSNNITDIQINTFESLSKLKVLDVGHNKIRTIGKQLFNSNTNLHTLILLDNQIQTIEARSFEKTHLTEFYIQNNRLAGVIEKHTFGGIQVNELNLSGGNLTSIEDEAFKDILNLNNLNLSSNALSNISRLAFYSLDNLNILDLSHNQLKELSFESSNLKNLSKLYAPYNQIEKVIKNVFENLVNLKELDLSYNIINEIETQAFSKLEYLETLILTGSHFVDNLEGKMLKGLVSLQKIDMSLTRTTHIRNGSFAGLVSLINLNVSFGQLTEIEYNAFIGSDSLEILTLSNNQLQCFHINTSSISKIQEINLNDNNIRNFSNDDFIHLSSLRKLYVANNKIITLRSDAFQYLNSLMYLDLSSNTRMKIFGNPFHNLSKLYRLTLKGVKTEITFENSSASVEILDLQSCGISNIDKVYIFNVWNVNFLNLSKNDILSIDKDSFGSMLSLVSLDLSLNKISNIQPGSFLHTYRLMNLNLYGNNLPSIQFGVFDGLKVLRDLNLSNNLLQSFDIKVLPAVTKLSLDDNIITKLDFKEIFDSEISVLSIGGNQLSCKVLADLKASIFSEKFKSIVTAKILNYHSENVNGILCQTIPNGIQTAIIPDSNNPSININPLISSLRNIIQKFDVSLQISSEHNNKTEELRDEVRNVIISLENILDSNNKNQVTSNQYLSTLTKINNDSNIQLGEIKTYLINITKNIEDYEPGAPNEKKLMDDQYLRLEFKKILKQETDVLREEFKSALISISKDVPKQVPLVAQERDSGDKTTVFYFIAVCLVIFLAVYVGNIVFRQVTLKRYNDGHTRNSATPISSIEME